MIRSLFYLVLRRILGLFRSKDRVRAEAEIEIAVLRHQLTVPWGTENQIMALTCMGWLSGFGVRESRASCCSRSFM